MKNQKGFTVVELMIAGAIGVFIVTGLINLIITSSRTMTLSDSLSINQETGRFAMDYMTTFIRKAGYSQQALQDIPPVVISSQNTNINCDDEDINLACSSNNPEDEPILGDRLSIFLEAPGGSRTCTGQIIPGPSNSFQSIAMVFWVSNSNLDKRELKCRTYNASEGNWLDDPVSIINNVEKFEFQVGVAVMPDSPQADKYVSINKLTADGSDIDNRNIRSIRIALLTTSLESEDPNKINSQTKTRQYSLLDAPIYSVKDGNIRNIFSNTIELPNMIGSAGL